MENNSLIDTWENTWNVEIHSTEYALRRIKAAQSAKLTPIKIDRANSCGYFQGSHGKYETFLNYCPCGDFHRSKLPCKHIYRLAIELGLLDEEADSNKNAIATPKSERISLDETIDIVEGLSENAQIELLRIASSVRLTSPTYPVRPSAGIEELLKSGLIVESDPKKQLVNFGKKADIIELLENENVPCNKNAKKGVLEELCLERIPEKAKEKFGISFYVSIPTKYSSQKIHYYLHRKFDSESFYDGANGRIFSDIPLLQTALPDDDVTNQLIKRGYYKR